MNSWYLGTMLYLIVSFSWAAFYAHACEKEGYAASSLVLVLLGLMWPVTVPLSFAIALYQIRQTRRDTDGRERAREIFNEMKAAERSAQQWDAASAEMRANYQTRKMHDAAGLDLPKPPMARFDSHWAASDVEAYLQGYAEVSDALADAEKWYDVSDDPEEREKFWYGK